MKPLQYAALQNNLPLLQLLLSKGADPNLGTRDLPPPLAIMVDFDNQPLAAELVLAGASPYQHTSHTWQFEDILINGTQVGDAPIHIACRRPTPSEANETRLWKRAAIKQSRVISMLDTLTSMSSQPVAGTQVLEAKGYSLLSVAVSSDLGRVCEWVLNQSFGPALLNSGSKPPLFIAIEQVRDPTEARGAC